MSGCGCGSALGCELGIDDHRHGRPSSYTNRRCRCESCRAAWTAYVAPRIKQWRADLRSKGRNSRNQPYKRVPA